MKPVLFASILTIASSAAFILDGERDAYACGGCFHAETDTSTSFVTDHRMAISISKDQSVLWDQVQFSGEPSEFAWVLPVREGTRVELARDEWIQVLEQSTRPSVKGPDIACGGSGGGGSDEGMSCGAADKSTALASESMVADGGAFNSGAGVQVVSQSVVGPYETVIVRSTKGEAIYFWLRVNHFAVPSAIEPILAHYTKEGFDFLALRLRPDAGVRAMQPVRVVMPGAVSTLPLRMVAAGAGAKLGLTLFVISEGRYQAKNFPNAVVDRAKVAWNLNEARSNYLDLAQEAMAAWGGRVWMTDSAIQPFGGAVTPSYASSSPSLGIERDYRDVCRTMAPINGPCRAGDAGLVSPAPSTLDASASADASAGGDSSVDAAAAPPEPFGAEQTCTIPACEAFDDDVVALTGLHRGDVWITRLRAELTPEDCSAGDLELEPAPVPWDLPPRMQTNKFTDPNANPCANIGGGDDDGSCACRTTTSKKPPTAPTFIALLGIAGILRSMLRRRR